MVQQHIRDLNLLRDVFLYVSSRTAHLFREGPEDGGKRLACVVLQLHPLLRLTSQRNSSRKLDGQIANPQQYVDGNVSLSGGVLLRRTCIFSSRRMVRDSSALLKW